jgi:hypothetical protein
MTSDRNDSRDIRSTADFEGALEALLQRAIDGGIDVRGAWTVQTTGSIRTWDVEVVELAADGDSPGGTDVPDDGA